MRLHEKRVSSFSLSGSYSGRLRGTWWSNENVRSNTTGSDAFHLRVWQQGFSLSSPFLLTLRPGSAYNEPFWLEMVRSYRRRVQKLVGFLPQIASLSHMAGCGTLAAALFLLGSERQLSRRIQPVMQQPCGLDFGSLVSKVARQSAAALRQPATIPAAGNCRGSINRPACASRLPATVVCAYRCSVDLEFAGGVPGDEG